MYELILRRRHLPDEKLKKKKRYSAKNRTLEQVEDREVQYGIAFQHGFWAECELGRATEI